MNTNPDETTLALWLDDELHGEQRAAMDAWAASQPEHIAAREEVRRWRAMIASALPASEEPPAAEFFNARIAHAIQEPAAEPANVANVATRRISWRSVLMPMAACAGMALTFWLGVKTNSGPPEIDVTGAPKAIPVEPIIYTPERGVKAEWFASSEASATIIVLDGVEAIPDSTDFSATASIGDPGAMEATAGVASEEIQTSSL
jgi:hypothetical protein